MKCLKFGAYRTMHTEVISISCFTARRSKWRSCHAHAVNPIRKILITFDVGFFVGDVFSPGSRTYYLSCILCTSHQYTNMTWKYHSNFLSLLNLSLDHKNHFHHLFQDFNLLNATILQDTTRAFYMKEQTINSRAPFEIIVLYLNFVITTNEP